MAKINDENATELAFHAPGNVMSAGAKRAAFKAQSTPVIKRKQAFGELNNLMLVSTPANMNSASFRPTVTVCNDAFRKHQQQQAKAPKPIQHSSTSSSREENDEEDEEENLFDYFDFNSCTKSCGKSDYEIWSENCLISDDFIANLLSGGGNKCDSDVESEYEYNCPFVRDDGVDITSVLSFPVEDDDIVPQELPPELIDEDVFFDSYII